MYIGWTKRTGYWTDISVKQKHITHIEPSKKTKSRQIKTHDTYKTHNILYLNYLEFISIFRFF